MISSRQAKELESSSVLARLTVALKTDDILVIIYSKEQPKSTIEVKFKQRCLFIYPFYSRNSRRATHEIKSRRNFTKCSNSQFITHKKRRFERLFFFYFRKVDCQSKGQGTELVALGNPVAADIVVGNSEEEMVVV